MGVSSGIHKVYRFKHSRSWWVLVEPTYLKTYARHKWVQSSPDFQGDKWDSPKVLRVRMPLPKILEKCSREYHDHWDDGPSTKNMKIRPIYPWGFLWRKGFAESMYLYSRCASWLNRRQDVRIWKKHMYFCDRLSRSSHPWKRCFRKSDSPGEKPEKMTWSQQHHFTAISCTPETFWDAESALHDHIRAHHLGIWRWR